MYSWGIVSRNVPVSTMAWQPCLHQPVTDCPIANLGGKPGEGRYFKHPPATNPVSAGSLSLGCSETWCLTPALSPHLLQ